MVTLRRIIFSWDRSRCMLWAGAETSDGKTYRVGFPLAHVEVVFGEELQREGVAVGPRVGGYPNTSEFIGWVDDLGRHFDGESVGAASIPVLGDADLLYYGDDELEPEVGKFRFGRKIRRAFRRTTKRIARRAKGMLRRVGKIGQQAGRLGAQALRSKAVNWAVRGAAVAFPAVGGPALAAYTAARTAANAVRTAQHAVRTGQRSAQAMRAITQGRNVVSQVRQLQARNDPRARFLRSALQSIR